MHGTPLELDLDGLPDTCLCIMGTLSDGSPFVSRDLAREHNTEQQLWRAARMNGLGANVGVFLQALNRDTQLWETKREFPRAILDAFADALAAREIEK